MGTLMLIGFVVAVYAAVRAMSRLTVRRVPVENHRMIRLPDGSFSHDASCHCNTGRRISR
jgi:hypothetical protein